MAGEKQRYLAAREAFNDYCIMDAPDLPDDELSAMQVELVRWRRRNFGLDSTNQNFVGSVEEMGEAFEEAILLLATGSSMGRMATVILKHEQKIRGLADKEEARAQLADAIADLMIFVTQVCTQNRIDFGTLYKETIKYVLARDWVANPETGDGAH